jgi:hypothetical protein
MAEGTKELKEALVGLLKLTAILGASFKDGVQVADFGVIMAKLQEPDVKAALEAAYQDVDKVPSEVSDLQLAEVLELLPVVIPEVVKVIEALKKA